MATYTLECGALTGKPCTHVYPMGERKNRIFDPIGDPKYATFYSTPVEFRVPHKIDQLTYLGYGINYTLTEEDKKAIKKTAKKGGHKLKEAEQHGIQYDTIIVQVAAKTRHGESIAARYYGEGSKYNTAGLPEMRKSNVRDICGSINGGCLQVSEIVEKKKHITKVIFQTSSQEVIDIATQIWDWQRDGFPTLPAGVGRNEAFVLHHKLQHLEAVNNGINVMLWKVGQEFLPGATFGVDCRFDQLINVPEGYRWDSVRNTAGFYDECLCGDCISRAQRREAQFAGTGGTCCNCPGARELFAKYGHLKAGDQLPLTNNANMDVKLTMKVDSQALAVRSVLNNPSLVADLLRGLN